MKRNNEAKETLYEVLVRYHWSEHVREHAPAFMQVMGDKEFSLGKFHTEGGAQVIAERERQSSPFDALCDSVEVRVEAKQRV